MSSQTIIVLVVGVLFIKVVQSCFTSSSTEEIHVKKGTAYFAECGCVTPGYNVEHLKWLDGHNQEIDVLRPGTDQKAYTERQTDSIRLYIPNVTKAKSGLYKCVTNFEGKEYSQNYYILAYEPITINPPEEQYILLGNRSLIRCKVHAEDESKVITSWHKTEDEKPPIPILNSEKFDITEDGLYINDVVDEDKGMYSCSAIDWQTNDEVDKDIYVKIITTPVIKDLRVVPQATVVAGGVLVMECLADGIPHPEYVWRKTDVGIIENPRWKQEVNTISIDPVLPEDQGKYECIAQSMAGVVTKAVDIQVYFPPNITSFPSITAAEGSTVQLVCDAIGRPAPNVSIIFIGEDDEEIRDVDENDVLDNLAFIKKLDKSHEGFYVCNASNEVNYTLDEMYLSVHYKPRFEDVEEFVWGWNGQVVNLTCSPDSNPPSNISWRFLGNNGMKTSDQVEVNKYLIRWVEVSDLRYLTVNISEETRMLYGIYECSAWNLLGKESKRIHFKEGLIPPSVKNATATDITATSVQFEIERPDSFEGPSILGYTAEYDKSVDYNITNIHSNRTWAINRPLIIENLKADTGYLIRFAPINLVGTGNWSEYFEFETLPPSVPSSPTWELSPDHMFDEVIYLNETEQVITWKAPIDNGAPVDYYTLKYCPITEEGPCREQIFEPEAELKVDLDNLQQNTTYSIELVAHNYIGNSTPINITIITPAKLRYPESLLSSSALIGISVVVVFVCLLILDLLLLMWRRQGIMANCCFRQNNNTNEDGVQARDKKGLLRSGDDSERTDNGHKEYEYNKTTGIITGKHSAV